MVCPYGLARSITMDGENGIYLSVVSQCVNCAAASAKDTEKRKKIAGKNDFRDFPPPVSPIVVFFLASLFNFWFASLSIRSYSRYYIWDDILRQTLFAIYLSKNEKFKVIFTNGIF